jgi:DNA mismatch repair protein MutS
MKFTTDRQTLDDLNIFGKHGTQSIFAMFDQTATRGGGLILEEMFQYPLSSADEINKRSGIIQSFLNVPAFVFDPELFDRAEQYLENTDQRTKLNSSEETATKKLVGLFAENSNYKFISQGLSGLITLLNNLRTFLAALQLSAEHPYREEEEAIKHLLEALAQEGRMSEKELKKLTFDQLADLDVHFRFRHREVLKKLLRYIYALDVYFSIGKVARERKLVFAQALTAKRPILNLEGVYHLQLNAAVANSFQLSENSNIMFLTGANMAGKSTFMKSAGVAMFLAHMGFPVPAKSMIFSVMGGIYTTINLPDNIGMGTSHFYAEVLRVKKIAKELSQNRNLFVIIDELFRGTNVKDAYEATVALTDAFSDKRSSMFVISTHIIEAGELLKKDHPNISFNYLPTRMDGNKPVYTYTLAQGITEDRHGMIIIQNEGIIAILKNGIKSKI